jgi:hypothetical protein
MSIAELMPTPVTRRHLLFDDNMLAATALAFDVVD